MVPNVNDGKTKIFRKNSNAFNYSDVLLATKISDSPLTTDELLKTMGTYFRADNLQSWK